MTEEEKQEVELFAGIGYTIQKIAILLEEDYQKLMFDYIFQFVDKIYLHVGANNIRSQIAVQRLDCTKIQEELVAYYGEEPKLNFVYEMTIYLLFETLFVHQLIHYSLRGTPLASLLILPVKIIIPLISPQIAPAPKQIDNAI